MGYLNADRVAQLIDVMVPATHKAIVLLVKVIIIIIQVTHRNHSLAVIGVYLTIDAIALNATDARVVSLAHMVAHKLHHLIFYGVALSILRYLLHIRAMLAQLLILIFIGRAASGLIAGQ